MGVELHIVRRKNFDDYEEESNITFDEWKLMVEGDNELSWTAYEWSNDEVDGNCCYWLKYPELDESNPPWFRYSNGMVSTKWIYGSCFEKLNEMSGQLGGGLKGMKAPCPKPILSI